MKATLIPKELLTAYERWEMESFDDKQPAAPAAQPQAATLTSEDILRIKERAWQEGYQAGMEQGYNNGQERGYDEGLAKGYSESQGQGWEYGHTTGLEKGLSDGHKEGYQNGLDTGHKEGFETGQAEGKTHIHELAQQLQVIAASFGSEVERASDAMASPMLDLVMDISKAVLKTALHIKPELVIPVINDAIAALPGMQLPLRLHVNPEDAELVRTHFKDDITQHGWQIIESADMARGGCRVETSSNDIDASIETRWKHIADTLHRQSDWLT